MNTIQHLENLLKTDVLVEVNAEIKALEQQIQKKPNKELKDELNYLKQVKQYFDEVVEDIRLGNLTQKDAQDILDSLEEMKADNEDDI
jgi:phosphotransacetylase